MVKSSWPQFAVRVPPDIMDAFEALAVQHGLSRPALARILIAQAVYGETSPEALIVAQKNAYAKAYTDVRRALERALEQFK